MRKRDLISGSFFFILGIYLIGGGSKLQFGSFSTPKTGFFPVILGVSLIFLSVISIGKALASERSKENHLFFKTNSLKIVFLFSTMIAYGVLVEIVGFLGTTFLWFSSIMLILKSGSPIKAFLYGAFASFACYVLFNILLQGQFPRGFVGI
jgi:hypothetical protein